MVNCSRYVELTVRKSPCIDLFLLVLFDKYVEVSSIFDIRNSNSEVRLIFVFRDSNSEVSSIFVFRFSRFNTEVCLLFDIRDSNSEVFFDFVFRFSRFKFRNTFDFPFPILEIQIQK